MSFECSSADYYDLPIIQTWQPCTISNNEVERPSLPIQPNPVLPPRARASSQVLTTRSLPSPVISTQKSLRSKLCTYLKWSPLILIAGICVIYFILAFILFCELCFCFYISLGEYELIGNETIVYQSALITVKYVMKNATLV